jgi:predicted RNA-binding protein YlxR (DUF448 family)
MMSRKKTQWKRQKIMARLERKEVSRFPIRTCVVCGKKKIKWSFNRLVLDEIGLVILDHTMTREGRGTYICNDPDCRKKVLKDDLLSRAFRAKKIKMNALMLEGNSIIE